MASSPGSTASTTVTAQAPQARATVFGIDVSAEVLPAVLQGAAASATGRRLDLRVTADADVSALDWPAGAELISEQLASDGTAEMRIEAHADTGYLISGRQYGAHLLSADGRRVTCACRDVAVADWQRLLIAQALPFAALLNGLEVFHASAVAAAGRAIAFAGPSGSGKSSVALEFCRRGAVLLADDVLALERDGDGLLAHPGCPVASLDPVGEVAHQGAVPGEVLSANARERLVRVSVADAPVPLAALFFLDRRPDGPSRPRFEPVEDARVVLASTFNFVLTGPERLRRLLDVCALVAEQRVERVSLGAPVDAAQLARAIDRRLQGPA